MAKLKRHYLAVVPGFTYGGDEEVRTPDLLTASQTRSQLRYAPDLRMVVASGTASYVSNYKLGCRLVSTGQIT